MRTLLITLIVCTMSAFAVQAQNTQNVTATGSGADRDKALDNAKRNAIEQVLGVVIATQSLTRNYQLVSDHIYSRAHGFVKSYRVLKEAESAAGGVEITIEAAVTPLLDDLLADQRAMDVLLDVKGRPRLMFLVNDQMDLGWYDKSTGMVETLLQQAFFDRNFTIVDRAQVEAIRSSDMARQAAAGSVEAVQSLGRTFNAECVVAGNATAARGGGAYGMISMRADVNVRVIRVDTGELLGVAHAAATKAQTSEEAAGRAAFEKVSRDVAGQVIGYVIRKWNNEAMNTTPMQLQITNIDFMKAGDFEEWLQSNVPGVQRVSAKPFEGNVAQYEVSYEGNASDLAKAIARNTEYPMTVQSMTQNKIVLTTK